MILVDTSVWIDFFRQSDPSIDNTLSDLLENNEVVALSAVFGELLQGAKNKEEEKIILEFWEYLPKIEEEELLIEAGKLSREHKFITKGVGLLDCCIMVACKLNNLQVWSLDKKLIEAHSGL
jgi:predicted nucleic acid-binding protein